ncbi:hypothetical protein EXN66_Car009008 [Channa argus]|uniref:Uncharacterized protein n=1 Tax=Channa argus TaxID=215402 RepID=A0A6G1PSU0_CHAAH|nr:hypothetical protein EXN66_Car009008 [Channa argus]
MEGFDFLLPEATVTGGAGSSALGLGPLASCRTGSTSLPELGTQVVFFQEFWFTCV